VRVDTPTVYILAGPNGAGKTSLYWYEASGVPRLNGDALYQQGYDQHAIEATLRQQQEALVAQRASFVLETNAANERDYALFAALRNAGYRLELRYIGLQSVNLCHDRVAQRVREGGHDVPSALIQHRYESSLSLLKRLYSSFDRLQLYDNSGTAFRLLADFASDELPVSVGTPPDWAALVLAHIARRVTLYQRLGK
jgi:predicted ABC-type ATPase